MIETIIRWVKRLGLVGGLAVLALYVTFWAWTLPSHVKVHITGTEIARKDVESKDGKSHTEDVRYVMAEGLEGSVYMFRNQDTGWGWPPYFKFDSGNIAAQAQSLSVNEDDPVVLVRYYGFRIPMLSTFPNILSMDETEADTPTIPWLVVIVVLVHLVLAGGLLAFVQGSRKASDEGLS
jgi:hypothetical protein